MKEERDKEFERLAAQMQRLSDDGWTGLGDYMRELPPLARRSLHDLVFPSKMSDEEFVGIMSDYPDIVKVVRRFARQSYVEVINRHYNGETVPDLDDLIDLDGEHPGSEG